MVVTSDLDRHDVTAPDGTRLRIYSVQPDGAREAVLCLHGGLSHARALFAPRVSGGTSHSWLHAIADRGRAAYALDVRGYGESDRLPEYDDSPDANEPPVRATDAAQDVNAAFEFVADRHDSLHLLGVSWGTMTGGVFLERYDARPTSVVQCAPVYDSPLEFAVAAEAFGIDVDLGAYIVESYEVVKERQGNGAVFEAVWEEMMDSTQALADRNAYVSQTGAIADTRDCCAGEPPYDANAIDVPTLVVRGSEDHTAQRADALTLYDELPSDRNEYVELRGGDHFVMHGRRRRDLYDLASAFQDRNGTHSD